MQCGTTHQVGKVGHGCAMGFILWFVLADALQQHIPFSVPGRELLFGCFPSDIVFVHSLVFVDTAGTGVDVSGKLAGTFGSMNVGREVVKAIAP